MHSPHITSKNPYTNKALAKPLGKRPLWYESGIVNAGKMYSDEVCFSALGQIFI